MRSKKAKLLARKHTVMRVITETQNDYRWWRHQETEPECGYVVDTTTYTVPAYPHPEKPKTRKEPRMRISRGQLRKRLYYAGYRGNELKSVFTEITEFEAQNFALAAKGDDQALRAMQGMRYPFGWDEQSIREKLGNRGWKALTKGIKPLLVVLDEMGYYMNQGMVDFMAKAMSFGRKTNARVHDAQQGVLSLPAPESMA